MTKDHPFPSTQALTAPFLIATNAPDSSLHMVINTLLASIPRVQVTRRVKGRGLGRPKPMPFTRQLKVAPESTGTKQNIGIFDLNDSGEAAGTERPWQLQISLKHHEPYAAIFSPVETVVEVAVTHYEIRRGVVRAAPQLALARHLVASMYRGLDHGSVVAGGQHDWHPEWWPDVPPASSADDH